MRCGLSVEPLTGQRPGGRDGAAELRGSQVGLGPRAPPLSFPPHPTPHPAGPAPLVQGEHPGGRIRPLVLNLPTVSDTEASEAGSCVLLWHRARSLHVSSWSRTLTKPVLVSNTRAHK